MPQHRPLISAPSEDVTVIRGTAVPEAPAISVIVMAIHADPRVADAVASLGSPGLPVEIIVVNTGRGSVRPILATQLDRLVLVESPTPRLPGGTRNLGLAEARAPIIAFLAADCLAAPGWIEGRVAAHAEAQAVASAIRPAPLPDGRAPLASWASCMLLHARRAPEYPAEDAARNGASYARALFDIHGTFFEDVRIAEDTEFNRRIAPVQPLWVPEIVTLHRYPATFGGALGDAFGRGRRLHDWMRAHTRFPRLRALRRIGGNFSHAMALIRHAPAGRRGTLLAAAPLVCGLALAYAAGALSQWGRKTPPTAG